jgi:hypothetical protein
MSKRYCTKDGCERKHHARGLCMTHYIQATRGRGVRQVKRTTRPLSRVGEILQDARISANLSVRAVCKRAGISDPTYYRILSEHDRGFQFICLESLAQALEVPLWRLFLPEDHPEAFS